MRKLLVVFLSGLALTAGGAAWAHHGHHVLHATRTLSATVVNTSSGYTFDPPPPGRVPAVSASQAVSKWVGPPPPSVTSITPILGVLTSDVGGVDHVLAWDVHLDGCFPLPAAPPPPGSGEQPHVFPCSKTMDWLIDATNGGVLEVIG